MHFVLITTKVTFNPLKVTGIHAIHDFLLVCLEMFSDIIGDFQEFQEDMCTKVEVCSGDILGRLKI